MTWLVLGVLLWVGAHLFKRVLPKQREALGKRGRPLVAVVIVVSIVLMIVGYREAEDVPLYGLSIWAWYLNNLLMLVALFMIDIGRVNGVVRTKVTSPHAERRRHLVRGAPSGDVPISVEIRGAGVAG